MSPLETQDTEDLQLVSLNKLLLVQSFDAEGRLGKTGPSQVLWYKTSMNVLRMSSEMHKLHHSNLVLSRWVGGAASLAPTGSSPLTVTLSQICELIWKPLLTEFCQLAVAFANASVTFRQLDRVLAESGDQGDGELLKRELRLMSETLDESGRVKPEDGWVELRLRQIQEYRQLRQAAAAAGAIRRIAERTALSGDFREIDALGELVSLLIAPDYKACFSSCRF